MIEATGAPTAQASAAEQAFALQAAYGNRYVQGLVKKLEIRSEGRGATLHRRPDEPAEGAEAGEARIPRDLEVMAQAPYRPGEISRLYRRLPPGERARLNAEIDRRFREATGFAGRLDAGKAAHRPYVRIWLHIRDRVMRERGHPWEAAEAALGAQEPSSTTGAAGGATPASEEGPQSFAGAEPGSQAVDPQLLAYNRAVEEQMLAVSEEYYDGGDLRWFFAYAHGQITRQINANLTAFQRPNELLRLNIHFAEEFLRAVGGQPHALWRRAFRVCEALERGSERTALLVGEAEWCGAAMANVHIHIDLAAALREVGCIPPQDYGNMLVFVNRGMLAALVRLRGRGLAAAETLIQAIAAPTLDLEVKAWRNAAYQQECNTPVPGVEPRFGRR